MEQSKKQIAIDFLNLASKGHAAAAFEKYVATGFKHHNAYFKGDAATLMAAMDENARKTPDKTFEIKRALEDDHLVAVHSHMKRNMADPGIAVVHIFRFEAGKIVELWDVGQPVPAETVNEQGMF